jgi:hypothetical protein
LTAVAAPPATGRIRPFRADDLPAVVALRRRVFRVSERPSDASLAAFCAEVFCRYPGADGVSPSLVYQGDRGEVAGFLGVLPRWFRFAGSPVRAAVATQLMVAPDQRGLAGRELVRAFFAGPQQLSLSDTANDAARRLWESLGAVASPVHSLSWVQPLRPFRFLAAERGAEAGPAGRFALRAGRPLISLADRIVAPRPVAEGATLEPFDVAVVVRHAEDVLAGYALRPMYDAPTLGWLVARAAEKGRLGPLEGRIVRAPDGGVAGWFLAYWGADGIVQVVQVAARARARQLVFDALRAHAAERGMVALAGRLDVGVAHPAAVRRSGIRHGGAWVLTRTQDPALAAAIARGDAFLSRLDGEWWMSF